MSLGLDKACVSRDGELVYACVVKRVLLTGMSGTGKSTLIHELRARGYRAVDMDEPDWSEYRTVPAPFHGGGEQEWVWREDRVRKLLSTEASEVLFVSGCASNQGQFYPQFDHIVLLTAPTALIVERLATRTTNDFGKHPEELTRVLRDQENVEPLLRRRATLELDTSAPIAEVVEAVVALVQG